ncbi:hypothetical protein [Cerasicoccus arenae]|nr:hypothetical protein [Cerasicoccus arenae]MBK1858703.1 hypothetical protein [Cerasicoccus arenae]
MRSTTALAALLLALTTPFANAQTATLESAKAVIPETFALPSSQSGIEASTLIENNGEQKFVFVQLQLKVDYQNAKELKLMMNEISANVGDETYSPVGDSNSDGRHLKAFRDPAREKESFRKRGKNEANADTAVLTLLFYFKPTGAFSVNFGDKSIEVTPTEVKRLEDAYLPKITVNEVTLRDRFSKAAPRTFTLTPSQTQVAAPLVGKVLDVKIQVVPTMPNRSGTARSYILQPADFSLVNGEQVIPMFQLVGSSSLMDNSIYTIGVDVDVEEAKQYAALEGVPYESTLGKELELLFLVDPSAPKWDLYFGANKVAEIPNKGF